MLRARSNNRDDELVTKRTKYKASDFNVQQAKLVFMTEETWASRQRQDKRGCQDLGKNCASRFILKFYIDTNNECRSQIKFPKQFTHPVKIVQGALNSVYMCRFTNIKRVQLGRCIDR